VPSCGVCPASLQELDLTGSRDFLDAETARQVLAPLLAANAAHKQVRPTQQQADELDTWGPRVWNLLCCSFAAGQLWGCCCMPL